MNTQAIVRVLAYKWIRIIDRMWTSKTPYSEQASIQRLKETNSPIIEFLET